jgi:hypothetical protein
MPNRYCVFFVSLIGGLASACQNTSVGRSSAALSTASSVTFALGPIKNGVGPMAAPGESATLTVKATLSGLPSGATPSLVFTGDTTLWPNANVPMTSKKGQVYTFTRAIPVPARIGRHALSWSFSAGGTTFGTALTSAFEVSCSNGKFCDGEERWTKRGCVSGPKACPPQAGTTVACDETLRTCVYTPKNGEPSCASKNCNPQCKPQDDCGDDGCGGRCVTSATNAAGTCNVGTCVERKCQNITVPGSCAVPAPLFGSTALVPDVGTRDPVTGLSAPVVIFGNSADGIDTVKLNCGGDGIKEWVYHFTVNVSMGVDIRALSADHSWLRARP